MQSLIDNDIINLVIQKTNLVIPTTTLNIINVFRSNNNDAWLIHFLFYRPNKEIEFCAEIYDNSEHITYYEFKDDLTEIPDLPKFVSADIFLPE